MKFFLMTFLIFSTISMSAMSSKISELPTDLVPTLELSEKAKAVLKFQPTSYVPFYAYYETDYEYPTQEIKNNVRLLRKALWSGRPADLFDCLLKNEPVMEALLTVTKDPFQKKLWVIGLTLHANVTSNKSALKFFDERKIKP